MFPSSRDGAWHSVFLKSMFIRITIHEHFVFLRKLFLLVLVLVFPFSITSTRTTTRTICLRRLPRCVYPWLKIYRRVHRRDERVDADGERKIRRRVETG